MIHQDKQWIMIDIKNCYHLAWNHSSLPPLLTAAPDPTGKSFLCKKNWNTFLQLSPNKKSVWEILKTLSPPSSLNKSRSQTWDHNPDRQTETRWYPPSEGGSFKNSALFFVWNEPCRWIWKSQEGRRASSRRLRRQCLSGTSHRTFRLHCK